MMHALIVDDDVEICLFFETVLEQMGFAFHTAHTIREAGKLNKGHRFDLVLLDLELHC